MPFPQRVRLLLVSLSPSKFGDEISCFADQGCLSQIPDTGSEFFPSQIPDLGSKFFPSWIPDPRSEFFPSGILDPGSASKNLSILTIRILTFYPSGSWSCIPDPESRGQKGTRALIPDPGSSSQHLRFWLCSGCRGYRWLLTFNGRCCFNNSFNGSALRSFYVQKRIFSIFYFNTISPIFTVSKLWCPAHLFPNTPRINRSQKDESGILGDRTLLYKTFPIILFWK